MLSLVFFFKSCAAKKRKKAARSSDLGLPSPGGLPDLDMDLNSLEADALDDDLDDEQDGKRSRLDDLLPFSQDLPDDLESDSEDQ